VADEKDLLLTAAGVAVVAYSGYKLLTLFSDFSLRPKTPAAEPDTDSATLWTDGPATPAPDTGGITPPRGPTGVSMGWAPVPIRPAIDVERWEAHQPTCGRFYRVRRGDCVEGIASRAIETEARRAAISSGACEQTASDWARRVARSWAIVQEGFNSISSGWNDEVYGSSRVSKTAPWGRGLELSAVHDDTRAAIAGGRTPRRNLDPQGTPLIPSRSHRPYLWIPTWDGAALLRSVTEKHHQGEALDTKPWPDGSSGTWPPPAVTERGVIHG